jgi:hypothetical protein
VEVMDLLAMEYWRMGGQCWVKRASLRWSKMANLLRNTNQDNLCRTKESKRYHQIMQ